MEQLPYVFFVMVIGFLFCVSVFIDFFFLRASSTVYILSAGLIVAGSVTIFAPPSKLKLDKACSNHL